jgi:lysophospholipase L1-like esterase
MSVLEEPYIYHISMLLMKHRVLWFGWLLTFAGVANAAEPLRVAILGDSTVCNYPAKKQERGWGMFIEGYFQPGTVKGFNLAKSGRSSKSFITEGLWDKARATKPDFVLIQFGHNDSHAKTEPKATDANGDFKDYLRRYIDESREIHAIPILVTPMHRRTFGADGKLADSLQPYANAMKEVAAEKKVALIDLHTSSGKLFAKLGVKGSEDFQNKPGDHTHFNEQGAKAMAELVMKEIANAEPRLKAKLKKQSAAEDKRSDHSRGSRT